MATDDETKEPSSNINVEELSNSLKRFGTIDYAVFIVMLVCCSMVGLYWGWKDHMKHKRSKKGNRRGSIVETEANDYLMGGRNMKVYPVAMSLVASFVSGITLLGTSTEIYLYGTQYMLIFFAILFAAIILHFTIIPVFHELQITSTYEYLQTRFDKRMRLFGSTMYTIATILWLPIVIYVPALAFNQTTGVNIHIITPVVMSICIFYTCLGGMKAVVWTDVIQITLMYGTLILIVVKGTMSVGGLSVVIERNYASGRFETPNFNPDPTIRHTFWTLVLAGTIFWVNVNGLNQNMVQRYMALKDVRTARKGQMIYVVGVSIMIFLCCYNGLLLYATYHDCDPLTTKLAKKKDQLLPLLVMEILKDIPGLPGLFISGVFSAALSSLSTGLNGMSAVILEDFFKPFMKRPLTELESSLIMRGTVLILGVSAVGLVYVVQHMGAVLQLSMAVPSACYGPMLGVYIIGLAIPWIGRKPTFYAAVIASTLMTILVFKVQAEISMGNIKFDVKPLSTEGCMYNFTLTNEISNTTEIPLLHEQEPRSKQIYDLSYLYYSPLGAIIVLILAFLFSFIFGFQDPKTVDQRLLLPFLRKYIYQNKMEKSLHCVDVNGREMIVHNFDHLEKDSLEKS